MADTRLSDLSAAGALSASDLFYVVQTPGSGGAKATGTQLLTLVGTTYLAKDGGTMTGALTIASGTLTASAPALSITQTWNNAAVTFHSAVIDITKTAAVATSTMLDLRIAGVSKVSFEYDASNYPVLRVGTSATSGRITTYQVDCQQILPNEIQLGGYSDTVLRRFSAGKAVMRSGSTQQALLISNFYTDASNYEGLTLTGVAGSSVNITAESLGTGASNLDVVITPKGTGAVKFGTHSAIAAETVTGYITIKDAGGTTRKLAVIS